MIRIRFENVGRGRITWEQTIREISYLCLLKAVKDKKVLASKSIDFDWEGDSPTKGLIFAGDRVVGKFTVIENEKTTIRTEA